jgi:copper chaperone CopZ
MNTYTFKIEGMTCHACESLITMDLEDAGLPTPKEIDADSGTMLIELEESQVEATKHAIAASDKYTVESVEQNEV